MKKYYLYLKMTMLFLNILLIGWVIYVLKDIYVYGHHIAIEPNQPLLLGEIVMCCVGAILALTVLVVEVRREIKK